MKTCEVPRLTTDRLLLREWQDRDLDDYASLMADPGVARHIGGVMDRQESWRSMAMHAGHWALRGYGQWAVERADGEFVGRVGLYNPEGWLGLEIGWALARHVWGNGYATEAAIAAMGWAWTVLDAPRLISVINPTNLASQRVAGRLGLIWLRTEDLHGEPVSIYGIDRPIELAGPAPE